MELREASPATPGPIELMRVTFRRSSSDDGVGMNLLAAWAAEESARSGGSGAPALSPEWEGPAADVLRALAPGADPNVFARLRREGIVIARDLAGLDKEDLRELGLTMLERSRVLRWAAPTRACTGSGLMMPKVNYEPSEVQLGRLETSIEQSSAESTEQDEDEDEDGKAENGEESSEESGHDCGAPGQAGMTARHSAAVGRGKKDHDDEALHQTACAGMTSTTVQCSGHHHTLVNLEARIPMENLSEDVHQRRLDEAEQRADFWCSIVTSAMPPPPKLGARRGSKGYYEEVIDLRENMIEELFDLSTERVETLYANMLRSTKSEDDGLEVDVYSTEAIMEALRQGLHRCGLPRLENQVLEKIMKVVCPDDTPNLGIAEFEAILSRLKLAQLLSGVCRLPLDKDNLGGRRVVLGQLVVQSSAHNSETLVVIDYGMQDKYIQDIRKAKQREFFFGHRKRPRFDADLPLVRWIHMNGLDLTLLLALTVKYGLHPLCVEDVIEQCPSKLDRTGGGHYFAAIEQLCLVNAPDGREPVRVHGRHVAIFCSGPPLFDTLVTVTEPDHNEKEDWPGEPVRDTVGAGDAWVARLRQRLASPHSRLRERRADFLMYQIIDLSADELVKVTKAYTTRLTSLEGQPHITVAGLTPEWLNEVSLVELQLQVVARRLKGLQRLIRRVIEDPDLLPFLTGYVSDVKDHIDEAHEDAMYLLEKCKAILEENERSVDEHQRKARERTADGLNARVFALTVATAMFSPMHFMCGVYGMNFVYAGGPSIPELLWPHGYVCFWVLILSYLGGSSCFAIWYWRRLKCKAEEDLRRIGEGNRNCPAGTRWASSAAHPPRLPPNASGGASPAASSIADATPVASGPGFGASAGLGGGGFGGLGGIGGAPSGETRRGALLLQTSGVTRPTSGEARSPSPAP